MDKVVKGRGAQINVGNRFSSVQEGDKYFSYEDDAPARTTYTAVFPKTILNDVKASDVPMDYSMNPYQGCEHGCIYCYARVTHEYWGYGPGLDFETKIMVKPNAPDLLRKKFMSKKWESTPIMLSGNTDCYQPIERKLEITRDVLKVFREFGNPVGILTKNSLIERDMDLIRELNQDSLIKVAFSMTTLNEDLRRVMEPRTSSAKRKLQSIEKFAKEGVPVSILIGPAIPGLNVHEIPAIIKSAADAGAQGVGFTTLRLNGAISDIFKDWLKKHFPDRYSKVVNQVKEVNGGVLGKLQGTGRVKTGGSTKDLIKNLVDLNRKKYMGDVEERKFNLDCFQRPGEQMSLF